MDNKIKLKISQQIWERNLTRLINQCYKCLPIYEEEGNWQSQQRTITLELLGYNSALLNSINFMILIGKLNALDYAENHFEFRKLIFEIITELCELRKIKIEE